MRYHDNGAFYSVSISAREVQDFARRWPCFGDTRAIWVQWDLAGNLVDIEGDTGMDESGVLALAADAQRWAFKVQARRTARGVKS